MAIWHGESSLGTHSALASAEGCPFCRTSLRHAGRVAREAPMEGDTLNDPATLWVCQVCGWWSLDQMGYGECSLSDPYTPGVDSQREFKAVASLLNLNVSIDETPLVDIRHYLAARWSSRGDVHPRLFEETVASVFRDLGYLARVTAYSGDGGVDVILDGPGEKTVGVQVRRRAEHIKVEQIRSLIGALVLEGYVEGIFVTTSNFQRGCYVAAERSRKIGLPITLVDGRQFLEALKLANLRSWEDYDLSKPPFTTAPLHLVAYRQGACSGPYKYVWQPEPEDGDSVAGS